VAKTLESTKIAKRYVGSLFSALTKKTDIKNVAADMNDLSAMISNSPELQNFIKSPLLSAEQHKAGLEKLAKKAKFSEAVTNLLMILADNRRLNILPVIAYEVENYLAKESGTVPVMVATARKLSAADQKKIGADIKKAVGQDIAMQNYVDETLIGGVVVQVESTLIDGSIKTKLDKLERELTSKAA
jgi:F-type H+-transporting ATPase subunit delta